MPQTLFSDFEIASVKAFSFHFPGIKVKGCHFHFCQSLRRKVDTIGLRKAYSANDRIKIWINMCMALSYVPLEQFDPASDIIQPRKDELKSSLAEEDREATGSETSVATDSNFGRGSRGGRGGRGSRSVRGGGYSISLNSIETRIKFHYNFP